MTYRAEDAPSPSEDTKLPSDDEPKPELAENVDVSSVEVAHPPPPPPNNLDDGDLLVNLSVLSFVMSVNVYPLTCTPFLFTLYSHAFFSFPLFLFI